jgi:ribosomal protein L11 methyltransferase
MPKGTLSTTLPERWIWQKLSSSKWEDVWWEQLAWLGQRLVITQFAGKPTVRIYAYDVSRTEADALVAQYGGSLKPFKPLTVRDLEPEPRPPLKIRGRLTVVGTVQEWESARKSSAHPVLVVPAGFAFGTGDHATTAGCLRCLSDAARKLRENEWDALDIGTGTGLLAMAARIFGARSVEASDNDPVALRVARENARQNEIKRIRFERSDVLRWQAPRQWDLVLANIYGPVLIQAAANITAAVKPGGTLILSGILRTQWADVRDAFAEHGFAFDAKEPRTRWVTKLGVLRG